jgi:glycosyltransferase involved in cell wall biosynthesis
VTTVHVVVPDSVDDPARPSGGNTYDRRVCAGLDAAGWSVQLHATPGAWPHPDVSARAALARLLAQLPYGAVVLLDGLLASGVPDVVVPEANRLRLVVLVHMPLGAGAADVTATPAAALEHRVLSAAAAVLTTSEWTRRVLLDSYALSPSHVHVAEPGVEPAALAPGTSTGGELLCVAAVTRNKGHDQLLRALATVADLPWRCTCVGSLALDPKWVEGLRRLSSESCIADRVRFLGPLHGRELDHRYAAADLLVLASRAETYGLVVTEALARGVPVLATAVGGVEEALGRTSEGALPGQLVAPGDTHGLADALRSWLGDDELRHRLRGAARARRATLSDWSATTRRVGDVLTQVTSAEPARHGIRRSQ